MRERKKRERERKVQKRKKKRIRRRELTEWMEQGLNVATKKYKKKDRIK